MAFLVGFALLLVLALPVLAFSFLPAVGSPSAQALNYSVTREVDGSVTLGVSACDRGQDVWVCEVYDESNSGSATYRVRLDGSCWTAVKTGGFGEEVPLPQRASGCVRFRDQLRLFDRI